MRKALIEDKTGDVKNVFVLEDGVPYTPLAGHSLRNADKNAEPGGHWDGVKFTKKPVTPPDPDVLRRIILEQKILVKLASLPEIQEFLTLRFNITEPDVFV